MNEKFCVLNKTKCENVFKGVSINVVSMYCMYNILFKARLHIRVPLYRIHVFD